MVVYTWCNYRQHYIPYNNIRLYNSQNTIFSTYWPGFVPCKGVTDQSGDAYVEGPDPQYPGIYLGLYRVKVSKVVGGRETIPSRYNTETELGFEATNDVPGVGNIEFHLKSG